MEIGKRVRYNCIDNSDDRNTGYYPPVGTLGTVVMIDEDQLLIKWDEGTVGDGKWWCNCEAVEPFNGFSYPLEIMRYVRQHLCLDEDDDSMDCKINDMDHDEIFEIVCNWNGLINYTSKIKSWVNGIYQTNI